MQKKMAQGFINDFPFYENLNPSYDWDNLSKVIHHRGKVGNMICQSIPVIDSGGVDFDDVVINEKRLLREKFNNNLVTRVIMSECPVSEGSSQKLKCDLGINIVESDASGLDVGWHNSIEKNINAILVVESFDDRSYIIGILRNILLELSVSNSHPVKSAINLLINKNKKYDELKYIYRKKIDYILNSNKNMIMNNYGPYFDSEYIPFSCFLNLNNAKKSKCKILISIWDEFILNLLSEINISPKDISESLSKWPIHGGYLNKSKVERLINLNAKPGVNYLIVTPSKKHSKYNNISDYEVIQFDQLFSKRFENILSAGNGEFGKAHSFIMKFYYK